MCSLAPAAPAGKAADDKLSGEVSPLLQHRATSASHTVCSLYSVRLSKTTLYTSCFCVPVLSLAFSFPAFIPLLLAQPLHLVSYLINWGVNKR